MQYGDEIRMLRTYDAGVGLVEGAVVEVAGSSGHGKATPGVARTLCQDAADGGGPYAERVEQKSTSDEESK